MIKTLRFISYLCLLGFVLFIGFTIHSYSKLPDVSQLRQIEFQIPLKIFSKDNELIGEFGKKKRTPILYKDIPQEFIHALIAAEDDNFFHHYGISISGLLRAVWQLIYTGKKQSGGSTITMQVARNFFLTKKQTYIRKFREILLALKIESLLSKEEILELYSNKIYFGKRAYGIQAAANVYYAKQLQTLNLAQFAMIAGLPKAPSRFNPVINPSRAQERRNWILKRMYLLNYINDLSLEQASNEPITAKDYGSILKYNATYATEMARQQILALYGESIYHQGYQVFTTLDTSLQRAADKAVKKGVINYDWRHGYRGAIENFIVEELISDGITAMIENNDVTKDKKTVLQNWQKKLASKPSTAGMIPAVVIQVTDEATDLLMADGATTTLSFNAKLKKVRRFITHSTKSKIAKNMHDLFAKGDVIYITKKKDTWELAQFPKIQSALISLDPSDGAINAVTGGFDFYHSHFNRAIQALRQPGSNFKPMLYSIALENQFTPATLINDAPIVFEDFNLEDYWRPTNDSHRFYGPTPLRKALYLSRNLVSIRILKSLGTPIAIEGLKRFGFDDEDLPNNLTLALGSQAMPPIKIATAYATFANGGYKISPYIIDHIKDRNGKIIMQAKPETVCPPCVGQKQSRPKAKRILDARVAYIMDNILKDVVKKGTARAARVLRRSDIAGKTGTTNGPKDAWFSGYNPDIVTTVWVGFDDNQLLGNREAGGSAALPIWIDFMRIALKNKKQRLLPQPDNLLKIRIDSKTGKRTNKKNSRAIFEYFLIENVPKEISNTDNNITKRSLTEKIF